jgi:thiol-disulfide isomerase/thioredoxin
MSRKEKTPGEEKHQPNRSEVIYYPLTGTMQEWDRFSDKFSKLIVMVSASWCNPCKTQFPEFQRLAHEYGQKCTFVKMETKTRVTPPFLEEFLKTYELDEDVPTYICISKLQYHAKPDGISLTEWVRKSLK